MNPAFSYSPAALLRRVPLTPKLLIITAAVGLAVWGALDYVQTQRLKHILYEQQLQMLNRKAQEARVRFDNYITGYDQAVKLITSQEQFRDYIKSAGYFRAGTMSVKRYYDIPPWLPDASVMRKFVRLQYALLIDGSGKVREIYQGSSTPPPSSMIQPGGLLQLLSSNQSVMTSLDGSPFVLTAETAGDRQTGSAVTLMIANPLDDDFMMVSTGLPDNQSITALVSAGSAPVVMTSNNPDHLPAGTKLSKLDEHYFITGKSFFDHGASDIEIQFMSFISKKEYERLGRSILSTERQQRAIFAVVLIFAFGFIIFIITRNILKLTEDVSDFSKRVLGLQQQEESSSGDEIYILKERFKRLTEEVASSKAELEKKNLELDGNRKKLQYALDELSSLIQQVAQQKSFGVRFFNPAIENCYETMGCAHTECPCYGKEGVRCWQVAGTYCLGAPSGHFVDKYEDCNECPVYKRATFDPVYQIGENFNNMMHILEMQHRELESAYTDLKTAQSQILQQDKMASIGQLAAGVAHEINNPMGFLISNLGMFDKYLGRLNEFINAQTEVISSACGQDAVTASGIEERRRKLKIDHIITDADQLLKESLEGADRVKKIVQNLKSFARLDEAELKTADINEGLESTINIVWNELKYKATVKKEYGGLPLLKCNPGQLNQVFMNMLVNAAHAIEKQGEIAVKTWHEGGDIHVSISDTGSGIPEDRINRIFEPFYTTKEVGKGTGLGLSIAYDIVKKHDGEITVQSEVGKGSVFTIRIPVRPSQLDK